MDYPKPLQTATESYYWKPSMALIRAVEVNCYVESEVVLSAPILDLGCGDGLISRILQTMGVIEKPLWGLDLSLGELQKAKRARAHANLLQADANHLPFRDASFAAILCNDFLGSIPGGESGSLREVNRVLKKDGILVATAPTDRFHEMLPLPRLLGKVSKRISTLYVRRLNRRLVHFTLHSPNRWEEKFQEAGLRTLRRKCFFSPRTGLTWNFINMHVFRLFAIFKLLNPEKRPLRLCGLLNRTFRDVYLGDEVATDFGFVLLIAKKDSD